VPSAHGEQTVHLIPQFEYDAGFKEILQSVFAELFARELFGWHTFEKDWPQHRTLKRFREWFTIEFHTIVEDLCGDPIFDDESDHGAQAEEDGRTYSSATVPTSVCEKSSPLYRRGSPSVLARA